MMFYFSPVHACLLEKSHVCQIIQINHNHKITVRRVIVRSFINFQEITVLHLDFFNLIISRQFERAFVTVIMFTNFHRPKGNQH